MGRFTITIEDTLLDEAREALKASTKTETIRKALLEVLRRKRLTDAAAHRGKIELDLDSKTLRQIRSTS